tara:strand:- start:2077 stop:3456 length:1380 start_codon:yes stop_codon:yes gene_type:complete
MIIRTQIKLLILIGLFLISYIFSVSIGINAVPLLILLIPAVFINGFLYGFNRSVEGLVWLIIYITWFTLLSILTAQISDDSVSIKILIALKEFFAIGLFTGLLKSKWKEIKLNKLDFIYIAFFGMYTAYGFFYGANLSSRFISYRAGLFIFIFYSIGRMYQLSIKEVILLIRTYLLSALIIGLSGVLEMFLVNFWEILDILKYANLKFSNAKVYNGVPSNFSTYIDGIRQRRMVGFFAEATSFGKYMATGLSFCFFFFIKTPRSINYLIGSVLFATCLYYSYSRGAQLLFLFSFSILLWKKQKILFSVFGSLVIVFIIQSSLFSLNSTNNGRHLSGLYAGLNAVKTNFIGHGLGTAGTALIMQNEITEGINESAKESFVGELTYQFGVPGITIFILIIIFNLKILIRVYNKKPNDIVLLVAGLSLGLFMTSILATSSVYTVSSYFILILTGHFSAQYEK